MKTKNMEKNIIPIDSTKKELTVHGKIGFPIDVHVNFPSNFGLGLVNWHWHNEMQFCIVNSGSVSIQVNSNVYILKEGQGVFINSGCLHMVKSIKSNSDSYICINFHSKLISLFQNSEIEQKYVLPYLSSYKNSSIPIYGKTDEENAILMDFSSICNLYSKANYGHELDIVSCLLQVWKKLIKLFDSIVTDKTQPNTDPLRIKAILQYINDNFEEKILLKDIANAVNLSREECCRYFKRVTKYTILDYITDCRINKSIELMQFSNLSMSQIAMTVGFSGISYFSSCFKNRLKCTPSEYKKRIS
ncbi:MAG: AraC family transcriptional regulator [Treponema sp.]|nr:AraC family transcriptional regulator [Treponema sp.]